MFVFGAGATARPRATASAPVYFRSPSSVRQRLPRRNGIFRKKLLTLFSDSVNYAQVSDIKIKPSKKLFALVTLAGSPYQAAKKWGIPNVTLTLFLDGKGSLPGNAVAKLVERTGYTYEDLFEHTK